jgi:hypothetical protein
MIREYFMSFTDQGMFGHVLITTADPASASIRTNLDVVHGPTTVRTPVEI